MNIRIEDLVAPSYILMNLEIVDSPRLLFLVKVMIY